MCHDGPPPALSLHSSIHSPRCLSQVCWLRSPQPGRSICCTHSSKPRLYSRRLQATTPARRQAGGGCNEAAAHQQVRMRLVLKLLGQSTHVLLRTELCSPSLLLTFCLAALPSPLTGKCSSNVQHTFPQAGWHHLWHVHPAV